MSKCLQNTCKHPHKKANQQNAASSPINRLIVCFFLQDTTQPVQIAEYRGFGLYLDVFIMALAQRIWRSRLQGSAATGERSRERLSRSGDNDNDSAALGKIVVRLKPMTREESDKGETLCLSASPQGRVVEGYDSCYICMILPLTMYVLW